MHYIIANDVEVEIISGQRPIQKQTPVWNLADWSLWVGDFNDGYTLEKLAAASLGSSNWLWDAVDTVLFSQQSKLLQAVALKVPDSIRFTSRNFQSTTCEIKQGELMLHATNNFRLPSCQSSIYNQKSDILLLIISNEINELEYDFCLEIFKDLSVIFNKGSHIGWMLQSASYYIAPHYVSLENKCNIDSKKRFYLLKYLLYFKQDLVKKLENADEKTKDELMLLLSEIRSEQSNFLIDIEEGVMALLDSYF